MGWEWTRSRLCPESLESCQNSNLKLRSREHEKKIALANYYHRKSPSMYAIKFLANLIRWYKLERFIKPWQSFNRLATCEMKIEKWHARFSGSSFRQLWHTCIPRYRYLDPWPRNVWYEKLGQKLSLPLPRVIEIGVIMQRVYVCVTIGAQMKASRWFEYILCITTCSKSACGKQKPHQPRIYAEGSAIKSASRRKFGPGRTHLLDLPNSIPICSLSLSLIAMIAPINAIRNARNCAKLRINARPVFICTTHHIHIHRYLRHKSCAPRISVARMRDCAVANCD